MKRFLCARGALAGVLALNGVAAAQLGLELGHPLLTFDNQGVTTYSPADGLFVVDATPIAVQFQQGLAPRFVTASGDPPAAFLALSIVVDGAGQLVSGVPGDDFIVFGEVDEDGDGSSDYAQVLLSGEVAAFGFADNEPEAPLPKASRERTTKFVYKAGQAGSMIAGNFLSTDEYELRFTPTGGSLLPLYADQDIGLQMVSEQSTFDGDWTVDFVGEAKGSVGPVPPLEQPGACCLETGDCAEVTESMCLAMNGDFLGQGVTCDSLSTFSYTRSFAFGEAQNNTAGNVDVFTTTYNPAAQRMTLEVTFSPKDGVLPNGFTHVVNCGPNPKEHPGELAIFYFDASNTGPWNAGPVLTVYAYNGATNSPNDSWKDGDGAGANDPDFDLIEASGVDDTFVYSLTSQDNPDGTRTLAFDIDVSKINAHAPLYPAPDASPWKGAQFDAGIGYWFHPFKFKNLDYEDNQGFIEKVEVSKQGWLDIANDSADATPQCEPKTGACCLPDGDCVELGEMACAAEGGVFQGQGVPCDALATFVYLRQFAFGEAQDNNAGNVDTFYTTYDPAAQRMRLEVTFSPKDGKLPNAFTHVVNNGPNPKNHPGELAIFYFDASNTGAAGPVLNVYAYNGKNVSPSDSWMDGDANPNDEPDPDLIASTIADDAFVYEFINQNNPDGTRTLGFDIDVSGINAHTPWHPAPDGSTWKGAQFDQGIGYWFHPLKVSDADYWPELGGYLTKLEVTKKGWLDIANDSADGSGGCVPTIGACCLPAGDCIEIAQDACAAQGGVFQGAGVGCDELDLYFYSRDFAFGEAQDNTAGNVDNMTMLFDPVTNRLLVEATFSPKNGVLPNGFTQVINNGPNPKNHPGELAIFYYDISTTGPGDDPILTVYAYNGATNNPNDSWKDGDADYTNDPDPDPILSTLADDAFVHELIKRDNPDGTITIGFDIDATAVINHTPAYPAPDGSPWTGAQFDTGIGYWFHPFKFEDLDYDSAGFLEDIETLKKGWLDIANDSADGSEGCVPTIGACCLSTGCVELSELACLEQNGLYQGAGSLCEDVVVYAFSRNFSQVEQNPGAGLVKTVNAFYSPGAQRLQWLTSYAPSPDGALPDSFSIVINDGASPYKHGVYAVVYFDATGPQPVVTVYAYNGNNPKSYKDGDNDPANDPNPDFIASSLIDPSFIYEASVENMGGMRIFTLDVDVSLINAHVPLFPSPDATPWFGIRFNQNIGYWLHSYLMDPPTYNDGKLVNWPFTKQGFVDVFGEPTEELGCLAAPQLMLHYDFAGPVGSIIKDRAGDADLQVIEDAGQVEFIDDSYGACVLFDQSENGKCCAVTASPTAAEYLRQALIASDAFTVQVFFKQTDDNPNGSRIISWSQGTDLGARNFSVIGVNGPNDFDNVTRLTTTGGTYNDGPTDAWDNAVPTVYAMTYDARADQKVRIYLNGQLVWVDDAPAGTLDNWKPYNLMLGNESSLNRAFQGAIYDVKVWDGALTETELQANANALLNPPDLGLGQ